MNRFEYISDEDLDHYAETERDNALSKAEAFMHNMTMDDLNDAWENMSHKDGTLLLQAIRAEDDLEVGSVLMDVLRATAKEATA